MKAKVLAGIALIIVSRIPDNESTIKIKPENRTPVKAVCQGIPYVKTTV